MRNTTQNLFPLIFNIMGALKGNFSLFFLEENPFLWGQQREENNRRKQIFGAYRGKREKGKELVIKKENSVQCAAIKEYDRYKNL